MSTKPKVDVVVADEYTKQALGSFTVDEHLVEIVFSGESANFDPRFKYLEKVLGKELHPLVEDFYKIALAVYISDLIFKRRPRTPNRTIRILLSVSDRNLWDLHKQHLDGVLYQLSADNLIFNFIQGKQASCPFAMTGDAETDWVVSLFSGGLDSLAGVSWLAENGLKPILVSHSSQNKISHLQKSLATRLGELLGDGPKFYQINAVRIGSKLKPKESSQRLRSFLYLTLGCVFALSRGISKLYIFENGILALNVAISNSRIFLNTRTAHPTFLSMYNDLVSKVFGIAFNVTNPFFDKTKAEAISLLDKKGFRDLINNTISCSRLVDVIMAGRPISQIWHCGVCLPCIIRRIATDAAGLSALDVNYADDVLGDIHHLPPEGRRVVFELLDFSRKLKECKNTDEVLLDFPAFFVEGFDPEPFIKIYLRFVDEIGNFFRQSPTLKQEVTW